MPWYSSVCKGPKFKLIMVHITLVLVHVTDMKNSPLDLIYYLLYGSSRKSGQKCLSGFIPRIEFCRPSSWNTGDVGGNVRPADMIAASLLASESKVKQLLTGH